MIVPVIVAVDSAREKVRRTAPGACKRRAGPRGGSASDELAALLARRDDGVKRSAGNLAYQAIEPPFAEGSELKRVWPEPGA